SSATPSASFRLHTPASPCHRFCTLPLSGDSLQRHPTAGQISPSSSRLIEMVGRIEFVAYGLMTHLWLLSTPPRSDAVTIGYRPENVCLKRICTSLTRHTCRRTRRASRSDARWGPDRADEQRSNLKALLVRAIRPASVSRPAAQADPANRGPFRSA